MTVHLVDLEPVDTRYTGQWKAYVPILLKEHGYKVNVISGPSDIPNATTPGAFLNFGGTNIYKARQVEQISRLFCSGRISRGDHFLFTDAWHPGIINLKYMSELLNIPVKIHALWHAGSYDPQDFLGRIIGNAPWVRHAESSFFHAINHNYFATDFHIHMFSRIFAEKCMTRLEWVEHQKMNKKIVRTGWPMEYMDALLDPYKNIEKENIILFPHRIAPEKQLNIFKDLAERLPQYQFITCQETQLTKKEYHTLLGKSKIVFSANLQETLGISCYEGAVVGAMPLVPDRLSYTEMYYNTFKYPREWTDSWEKYLTHRDLLVNRINEMMIFYDNYVEMIKKQKEKLENEFFSSTALLENLK